MEELVDKFGLYCQHFHYAIPEIKNLKDCATLQGKLEKPVNAKVLCSGFFSDFLSAVKVFSWASQKSHINIVAIAENVEWTKKGCEKLLKKFQGNNEAIFIDLSKLSVIIVETEGNEYGESICQDQKVKYYAQEKLHLKYHGVELIESILSF